MVGCLKMLSVFPVQHKMIVLALSRRRGLCFQKVIWLLSHFLLSHSLLEGDGAADDGWWLMALVLVDCVWYKLLTYLNLTWFSILKSFTAVQNLKNLLLNLVDNNQLSVFLSGIIHPTQLLFISLYYNISRVWGTTVPNRKFNCFLSLLFCWPLAIGLEWLLMGKKLITLNYSLWNSLVKYPIH